MKPSMVEETMSLTVLPELSGGGWDLIYLDYTGGGERG